MLRVFEAWSDDAGGSITFAEVDEIAVLRSRGLLAASAHLIHRVHAETHEEAQAAHHVKMGWSPYKPFGSAADCPAGCGAQYYPEGSGECPNCGKINTEGRVLVEPLSRMG